VRCVNDTRAAMGGLALGVLAAWLGIATPLAQVRTADAASRWTLASIQTVGNQRYSTDQVAQISGLMLRQQISVAEIDGAIARMGQTGLFTGIAYRYAVDRTLGELALTFEISEPKWDNQVVFDNFVWFSDADLTSVIEAALPTFDGMLPTADGAITSVIRSLESFLKLNDLPGTVVIKRHLGGSASASAYVFSVKDSTFPICAVTTTGTTAAMSGDVMTALHGIVGNAYSRSAVASTARSSLTELYWKHGYLAFAVGDPLHTLNGHCRGVSVVIPVAEGVQYRWGSIGWIGISAAEQRGLDTVLGLSMEAPANIAALESQRTAVGQALGRGGHIEAKVVYRFRLDAAARRAHLTMQVNKGQQFRFGTVEFVNLPPAARESLVNVWTLKEGSAYDGTYLSSFIRDHISDLSRRHNLSSFRPVVTIAPGTTVVNIRIEFTTR